LLSQVLLVLIRIEAYFLIAFVVLYGIVNVHYAQPEFGLTMALIPALAIQVLMTVAFTRSENVLGALAAIVSSLHPSHHRAQLLTHMTQVLRLGEIAYLVTRTLLLTGDGRSSR
jgi:hypothetical protein